MRYLLPFLILIFSGCQYKKPNKFHDDVLIKIAQHQDKRETDSLLVFLSNPDPKYREEAAWALASVQDTSASLTLQRLLSEDKSIGVRKAAAYALGQTGGIEAVKALKAALTDTDHDIVREVLEALGKTLPKDDLHVLKNYQPTDSLTAAGLLWGYYRMGLRSMADTTMTTKAASYLSADQPYTVRLAAAHFFGRNNIVPTQAKSQLIRSATSDPRPEIRMAVLGGLRKIKDEEVVNAVKQIVLQDTDYRVRANAARAFSVLGWHDVLLQAIADSNPNVGVAAAEVTNQAGLEDKKPEILNLFKEGKNWRIKSLLAQWLMRQDTTLSTLVRERYQVSDNSYEKAGLLAALSGNINESNFVVGELVASKEPVIKTSAAQALVNMNRAREFSGEERKTFASFYKKAIENGDQGVISIIASALADSTLGYKKELTDISFLMAAKSKLSLPRDYEALQPLEEAIAYLTGKPKPKTPANEYNHPPDWDQIRKIKNDIRIKFTTGKGEFVMKMLVEESPASVLNFINLAKANYFDGKYFHRVVPNFVAQTGCNRGDGFGSEAYSIRSELGPRRYMEGAVGMASAGKDTEGTQWFITHSPTPHLDGRYTIFAIVERGMDVIHLIEVGDAIIKAEIVE